MCETDVFVFRQVLLLCGVCLYSFTSGIIVALPSVLNPAILAPNADIKATPEQASCIAAAHGISGIVGYMVMSPIFEVFGRKTANIVVNLFIVIGSFIYYVASDVYSLAFGKLAQGLSAGGVFISIMALCECTSPKRRGYFMVLNKAALGVGFLTCHSLAFILNWRQIIVYGNLIPMSIGIILFSICAESPSFYASRGEFDKCGTSFKWYRGNSAEANKELQELVAAQMKNFEAKRKEGVNIFKKTVLMMMTKEFRKSILIMILATLSIDSCGRFFQLVYMNQILGDIFDTTSIAKYVSIASDCIMIFALFISCFMVKIFKRRTLLFNLGFCAVFLMYFISFSIVLPRYLNINNIQWLTPSVILIHTFITNIGLVPIAFALTGEVFSLQQKGVGAFISGIVFVTFYSLVMKVTPLMIDKTGVEGTYAIYGFCLFVCLMLLRFVLPETKDKTLQQIEDEIKGITRNNSDNDSLKYSKINVC